VKRAPLPLSTSTYADRIEHCCPVDDTNVAFEKGYGETTIPSILQRREERCEMRM
jgi:hypothetical protein